jgi:hypothetical protein
MSVSAAYEIGIVHYPGAQVAVSWALLICSASLPRLRAINGLAKAHFVLRIGNRSIAATRIFLASMTAPRAAAQSRGP